MKKIALKQWCNLVTDMSTILYLADSLEDAQAMLKVASHGEDAPIPDVDIMREGDVSVYTDNVLQVLTDSVGYGQTILTVGVYPDRDDILYITRNNDHGEFSIDTRTRMMHKPVMVDTLPDGLTWLVMLGVVPAGLGTDLTDVTVH